MSKIVPTCQAEEAAGAPSKWSALCVQPAFDILTNDDATSGLSRAEANTRHEATRGSAVFDSVFEFGRFTFMPARRLLLDGESRVRIGSRALELLAVLVERAGEVVTRHELMSRAWPKSVVDESNLKVQIAALRKALGETSLGERYLATVVGQGYRFVAPVNARALLADNARPRERPDATHNVPAGLMRLVGRSADIDAILARLPCTRIMTVTGAGGAGKTSIALAVARSIVETSRYDVWWVDLSMLSDPRLVPCAIATAVGLTTRSSDITSALATYFCSRSHRQWLLLDNCEHVVEAASAIAGRLVLAAPRLQILATSREPLRATGENVYRLAPLGSPVESAGLSASEALQYPAIQLFAERAAARCSDFALCDDNAPMVAEICRRLDGIPLAIGLAAARLDAFCVRELLAQLDDRFIALGSGQRTGAQRHRSLLATLDWSHQLLTEVERLVLRRLGVFADAFCLDSAITIAADEEPRAARISDALSSLVEKSWVTVEKDGDNIRYRLLETTRHYARRKLAEAGELDLVARRR
ncbi:helix-turn-helix transcriptional regulator [Paraburkholderia sp. CNPSo 3274]|uniref:ATP-binding protein n=1 Tax=Paraburkholderia sp. CNPSo 3274 TaxID=2940932 RepID=UPI0020B8CB5B|nr:winged helix-turn-helix domain-containing protein [Paraburkholderia sp. CNPSo 3274]MCP3709251.1 helix-turn-helix transcriptional regulator [Paraburkholderia sp. CNPSo 3274]